MSIAPHTAPSSDTTSAISTRGAGRMWRRAKVRTGILLWALGVPIPIILLIFLLRGCV